MLVQRFLRQTARLAAEEQTVAVSVAYLGVGPRRVSAEANHARAAECRLERRQVVMPMDLDLPPVIAPGPAQRAVVDAEAQPADQVQRRPGGRAGTGDVAGVRRNLRFPEREMQHRRNPLRPGSRLRLRL